MFWHGEITNYSFGAPFEAETSGPISVLGQESEGSQEVFSIQLHRHTRKSMYLKLIKDGRVMLSQFQG